MAKYTMLDEAGADVGCAESIGQAIDVALGRLRVGIGRRIAVRENRFGTSIGFVQIVPTGPQRAFVSIRISAEVDTE